MADFNRYRIYCETEAAWVEEQADVEPTTCPNNPAHTVRAGSAAELDSKRIILVPEPDGQGILGGDTGVGDEMERVIGAMRIEKSTAYAVPALTMQCSTGHPTGYGCLQLDMDIDGVALVIDSEATSFPLLQLDGLSANSRGDVAFGASRVADPGAPSEGDLWFDGASHYFKYRDNASVRAIVPSSEVYWTNDGIGHIYAKTAADDLYIGGATPNGVWFDSGNLVLGGASMAGSERLRVNGSHLIDQDGNAVGLDIDSESTDYPLINLQGLNGNSRGDIAFGTARTGDPSAPSEGDLWYESTSGELKFRKNASTVEVRNAIKLQGYAVATTAPTSQYVLAWNNTASEWQPTSMAGLPGPYHSVASATASTTTTSATDVLIAGMTITPPAGTYVVFFSTTFEHSSNGSTIWASIYSGGTQVAYSEQMITNARWINSDYPCALQAVVTVNGTQAIETRWRTSVATATSLARSIIVMRVS